MTLMFKPLDQFEIVVLWPFLIRFDNFLLDFSLTNFSLYIILFSFFFYLSVQILKQSTIVPSIWQLNLENFYIFVYNLILEQVGVPGLVYLPFFFVLFFFLLISNLVGMTPFSFAITSQFVVTFTLSITVLVGLTLIGFCKHGFHFLSLFYPKGVPFALVPFLIFMEFISYLMRGVSLAVRLFANIMAGHSLLYILTGFLLQLSKKKLFFGLFPFCIILAVFCLEWLIAALQAYVFFLLSLIYLNEVLNLH